MKKEIDEVKEQIKALQRRQAKLAAQEAAMKAQFEDKIMVQHIDGSVVGLADDYTEAETMMRADAERRQKEAVEQCRAKHVKIVVAQVSTSDYVLTQVKVWADKEA